MNVWPTCQPSPWSRRSVAIVLVVRMSVLVVQVVTLVVVRMSVQVVGRTLTTCPIGYFVKYVTMSLFHEMS